MDPALLEGLNPEQARAVSTLDGPLLILAGAGSGKTRVLTRRIAALLWRGTVGDAPDAPWLRPWNILAVTFTNKAAEEMRHRVEALVGEAARQVWVSTFHSTCVRILRQDIEPLGWRRDFVVYDDDDQLRVIKAVLEEHKISVKELPPNSVRGRIDRHKNGLSAGETLLRSDPFPKLLASYEARMKAANALDFNDLINKVVQLWTEQPEILEKWQKRWRYVLVDEYQDTNPAQYQLLKLIAGKERNLAVVGDDDQSIYRFRGADIRNILEFEQDFPGAAVIKLEQNYRSKGNILKAATGVVRNNQERKDKTLRTDADDGDPVQLLLSDDEATEADAVVAHMLRMERRWGDYAVIYRTNAQSRPVEQALTRNRIPYTLVGGRKFYDRAEVKDMLGYLRLLLNRDDDLAFQRVVNVPPRGLGDKAIENLKAEAAARGGNLRSAARTLGGAGGRAGNSLAAFTLLMDRLERAAELMPVPELVEYVVTESGYEAMLKAEDTDEARGRLENLRELVTSAHAALEEPDDDGVLPPPGPLSLRHFLDRATLSGQADELPDEGAGAVTLLTAHLAKGLEFPVVFVVGMVEKCFPHSRAELQAEIEEERRLAYVAFTRARERLFISAPRRRRGPEGWWDDAMLSRFVAEIPDEAVSGRERARGSMAVYRGSFGGSGGGGGGGGFSSGLFGRGAPAPAPGRPAAPPRAGGFGAVLPMRTSGTSAGVAPRAASSSFSDSPAPRALPGARGTPTAPPLSPNATRPAGLRTMVPENLDRFQEGVEVFHGKLGCGVIRKREGTPSNPRLTIHFDSAGPRTVLAVAAGLELVLRS